MFSAVVTDESRSPDTLRVPTLLSSRILNADQKHTSNVPASKSKSLNEDIDGPPHFSSSSPIFINYINPNGYVRW